MAAAPRPGSSAKAVVLLRPQTAGEGTMAEPVGFVGVGRMGAPMVRRLLAHGYEVVIRDVNDAAVAPFEEQVEIREKGGGR